MFNSLADVISTQGYWGVAAIVGLESMGIPLPGETALPEELDDGLVQRLPVILVRLADVYPHQRSFALKFLMCHVGS
jgi:hypothetical protein